MLFGGPPIRARFTSLVILSVTFLHFSQAALSGGPLKVADGFTLGPGLSSASYGEMPSPHEFYAHDVADNGDSSDSHKHIVDKRAFTMHKEVIKVEAVEGRAARIQGDRICERSYQRYGQHHFCNNPDDRECWLKPYARTGGKEFNIHTDYDIHFPEGVIREYDFFLRDVPQENSKPAGRESRGKHYINGIYPGPHIEACWGDTIRVNVYNQMAENGTTIHWHGFRQLNTARMDGVNGITQCGIAPNDYFTYEFKATQYGTTWYHSHYSTQYLDGIMGPITIYGPTSANYDHELQPMLISDWVHESATHYFDEELAGHAVVAENLLVNGRAPRYCKIRKEDPRCQVHETRHSYTKFHVEHGKKSKLTIINGSVGTHIRLSIDNHKFTVVKMDMVPIKPFERNWIDIGIGQRYTIIIGDPIDDAAWDDNHAYWIRLRRPHGTEGAVHNEEEIAYITYNDNVDAPPPTYSLPIHNPEQVYEGIVPWPIDRETLQPLDRDDPRFTLADHPYSGVFGFEDATPNNTNPRGINVNNAALSAFGKASIYTRSNVLSYVKQRRDFNEHYYQPVVPWYINGYRYDRTIRLQIAYTQANAFREKGHKSYRWAFNDWPFWLRDWTKSLMRIWFKERIYGADDYVDHNDESNFGVNGDNTQNNRPTLQLQSDDGSWQFVLIEANFTTRYLGRIPTLHPMHLHGHDFAIIGEGNDYFEKIGTEARLQLNNPVRRDVVLVPPQGWVMIAFRTDNPGPWLLHCHIAMHASAGLAITFMERPNEVIVDPRHDEICDNFRKHINDPNNNFDMGDSGV